MPFRDYEEFIGAVAYHARPRATKDFDIFIDPTPANAKKVLAALTSFLGTDLGYTTGDLCEPGSFINLASRRFASRLRPSGDTAKGTVSLVVSIRLAKGPPYAA